LSVTNHCCSLLSTFLFMKPADEHWSVFSVFFSGRTNNILGKSPVICENSCMMWGLVVQWCYSGLAEKRIHIEGHFPSRVNERSVCWHSVPSHLSSGVLHSGNLSVPAQLVHYLRIALALWGQYNVSWITPLYWDFFFW